MKKASRSRDHVSHLAVHGFLHLLGYDHDNDAAAEAMEQLERVILARLGVPDPYRRMKACSGKSRRSGSGLTPPCPTPTRQVAAIPPALRPTRVNLPAVSRSKLRRRENGDGWLVRMLRDLFGWKSNTARADLQTVLANGTLGETDFSPQERTMLTNILALRGRRIDDVMVPRADIISVQRDIRSAI